MTLAHFNGNAPLTSGVVATNRVAPDGFLWDMAGGNIFVGRNTMINHWFEAVQVNGGPNAVAGNIFSNAVVDAAACAVRNSQSSAFAGADGTTNGNFPTTFVGNWVCGEFNGAYSLLDSSSYASANTNGVPYRMPNYLYVCGNFFNFPGAAANVYPGTEDTPGILANTEICTTVNICGNRLASGCYGLLFTDACTNALVLNNDFSGAIFGGIGNAPGNAISMLPTGLVIGNNIAANVSFHVQLPPQLTNSLTWYLYENQFLNSRSNAVPAFLDPVSSGVHIVNY